ncbi:Outer membrane efflux protein [Thalassoglobus neptunius]|uniref:Outer membrane efflux protein n=1 Tax=Thalassoglobus neptunius TaxID=1938619 RepID=A0A5C5X3C8_9PLAN|nr:TolC family protein [Thalassoglobus neptunius]TWT56665.1 Outer membrane efflux protein [Thalassoglobus neptunius]
MLRMHQKSGRKWRLATAVLASLAVGCVQSRNDVSYLGDPNVSYYRDHATEIDYPAVDSPISPEVVDTQVPVTVRSKEHLEIREISLGEAVQTALMNSEIIRPAGTFLSTGNSIYTNPNQIPSVYDPAIQESGVLFGGRGVEAALSAFDAQFQTSMIWGRNEQATNNAFSGGGIAGGGIQVAETGTFASSLSKTFANGGSLSVNHNVNYLGTNAPSVFQSVYSGNVQLQYQLPLLAGAGTEFTRIAGPIGQSFGGISGVSQGVLIARINNDVTIADFQLAVRNLVKDVEDAYWDLYLAYQQFHVAIQTRESTYKLRQLFATQYEIGQQGVYLSDVYQASDQFYGTEVSATNAQAAIYSQEIRLRRLLGLPVSDGTVLRPSDAPVTAEIIPDWYQSLTEALTHRTELRRQKWNIKSLQLQLQAAESLVRPRLDFVSGYQINGFGDELLGYNQPEFGNFYESVGTSNLTGWNLGFQMRWDIGMRSQRAQVQNYELRLAKAEKVLMEQEEEISLELGISFQELSRTYQAAASNYNRVDAVQREIKNRRERLNLIEDPDVVLRSVIRGAEAEIAYHQSVVDYNKAITNFELRKGTLLINSGVMLAEGGWQPEAYEDARYHSDARLHAKPAKLPVESPPSFSVDAPFGGVYLSRPASESGHQLMPIESDLESLPPIGDDVAPMENGAAGSTPQLAPPAPSGDVPAAPPSPAATPAAPQPPAVQQQPTVPSVTPQEAPEPLQKPNVDPPAKPDGQGSTTSTTEVFDESFVWKPNK